MQVYALNINDFSDNEYTLIGIHTALTDYKLAYLLNKYLEVQFYRANYNLEFTVKNNNSSYVVYEYIESKLDYNWFLISNIHKTTKKSIVTSLFSESDSIMYLIPEKKRVDYFIKLEGDFDDEYITEIIDVINKIPQIITSYTIETNTLKSKDFLIF